MRGTIKMHALILNSGIGSRMGALSSQYPKCMTEISSNETILSRQLRQLYEAGIENIVITTGKYSDILFHYCQSLHTKLNIRYVKNPDYEKTNYIYSIYCARKYLIDDIILLHGDLVLDDEIIKEIIACKKSCMAVSSNMDLPKKDFKAVIQNGIISKIGIEYFDEAIAAQPLYKLLKEDWNIWLGQIKEFCEHGNTCCYAENAFNEISNQFELIPLDVKNKLCHEIDNYEDLLFVLNEIGKSEREASLNIFKS